MNLQAKSIKKLIHTTVENSEITLQADLIICCTKSLSAKVHELQWRMMDHNVSLFKLVPNHEIVQDGCSDRASEFEVDNGNENNEYPAI